jgi:hypothetical protein
MAEVGFNTEKMSQTKRLNSLVNDVNWHRTKHIKVNRNLPQKRKKRQFDFSLGANHEEGIGTNLNLESRANLWRSKSGNTKLDGSASWSKHFGSYGSNGRGKYSAILNFSHNY